MPSLFFVSHHIQTLKSHQKWSYLEPLIRGVFLEAFSNTVITKLMHRNWQCTQTLEIIHSLSNFLSQLSQTHFTRSFLGYETKWPHPFWRLPPQRSLTSPLTVEGILRKEMKESGGHEDKVEARHPRFLSPLFSSSF